MNCKFELTEQPAQPVLSVRTRTSVGNLPQALGKAYGAIIQYLNEIGEQPLEAAFAAYYNMDMEDLDVEIRTTSKSHYMIRHQLVPMHPQHSS